MLFFLLVFTTLIVNGGARTAWGREKCGPGWFPSTLVDDVCTKVVMEEKKTFSGARLYCQGLGGDLVTSIEADVEMYDVMMNYPEPSGLNFGLDFWIGVHDDDKDGVPTYVDGSSVKRKRPFWRGSGISVAEQRYCVSIVMGSWRGRNCNEQHFFICEKAPSSHGKHAFKLEK